MKPADILDQAANALEEQAHVANFGYVEASSLSRLLNMVGTPENKTDPTTNKKMIDFNVGRAFAILTAWKDVLDDKPLSEKQNWARNRLLLNELNAKKMGAYKLIGFFQNPPEGMTYDEARDQGKLLPASREESFFVTKPKDMEFDEFENIIGGLANKYDQWAYLISNGKEVFEVSKAARKSLGNRLVMPKIQQAYSRMRGYGDKPFVFAGVVTPDSIGQMRYFQHIGLNWIPRIK
jgi:hypothetical protein